MSKKTLHSLLALAVLLTLCSCHNTSKFVYLQDMEMGIGYPYDVKREPVIHINDRLNITVSCNNPELAIPFNGGGGSVQVDGSGNVSSRAVVSSREGYRVDVDGNIQFPILGKIHVEGKKVSDVTNEIKQLIIDGKYIKDPMVSLDFLNFRYTVLGAVGSTGTYNVTDGRITLLDAIAKAGDVGRNGRVDRVHVIREEGGERVEFVHDLRSKDVFDSPCYYLQQNDIVYVEPRYLKQDSSDTAWKYITFLVSLISAACSVIWVTRN